MLPIIPNKLKQGDEIRVIAPSRSLAIITEQTRKIANQRFEDLGLKLSFGQHVIESDVFYSSSIKSRLHDLHEAFHDKNIKAIFTVLGGYNVNQLLDGIDYQLIASNPKILCGYSDITALQNAIYAKTGLVTYSGPHYSSLGMEQGIDWSLDYLIKCLFNEAPYIIEASTQWSDDAWFLDQTNRHFMSNDGHWIIQPGEAKGTILGANLCTLNLLQGSAFMPSLENSILFLEDDALTGNESAVIFDRDLQSLIQQPGFEGVKGLIIGRFQKASHICCDLLKTIIQNKKELRNMPIIANVDFGHTDPMITFPIGGTIQIEAAEQTKLTILSH
ncbi:MAG TPA: LD-carboxypeptidase [Legionella sp.]|nr:LD-carboxypeptidase [Legionella sp.]